jgi:anti-sigma factor RsiW
VIPSSAHIPFARLTDLAEGRLSAGEQTRLQSHLTACPRCAADLAWLERVITCLRTDDSTDPPPQVIARAVQLFAARAGRTAPAAGWPERILAVLRFDSAQSPLALGQRAGPAPARQLLFSAGAHDLDLRLTPAGEAWVVTGQVLGPDTTGRAEQRGAANVVQAVLSDLSEFALPAVPAGHYALVLHLADAEVEVADLPVGSA